MDSKAFASTKAFLESEEISDAHPAEMSPQASEVHPEDPPKYPLDGIEGLGAQWFKGGKNR